MLLGTNGLTCVSSFAITCRQTALAVNDSLDWWKFRRHVTGAPINVAIIISTSRIASRIASRISIIAPTRIIGCIGQRFAFKTESFLAILTGWAFVESIARGCAKPLSLFIDIAVFGWGTDLRVGAVSRPVTLKQPAFTIPTGQPATAVGRIDALLLRFPA